MNFTPLASSSAGNAYLVAEAGCAPLLIDPGIRFAALRQALNHQVAGLAGCLLSHQHGDHSKSAADILRAGVPLYTSAACAAALGISGHHRLTAVEPAEPVSIGPWRVLPWLGVHDVECLGFVIQAPSGDRLLYCTDTAYIPYRFTGLTHLAIEANHSAAIVNQRLREGDLHPGLGKRIQTSHMSIETVMEFFEANEWTSLREVHLLHLSNANSNAAEFLVWVRRACGVPVYVAAA